MEITFDNVLEKVVNNRTLSRRDKLNELRKFIKEYSSANKPKSEEELAILETLKNVKKTYTLQDLNEKNRDKVTNSF